MVYFIVVRPKEKETGRRYCQNKDELFKLAKNVNEFVANNNPYTIEHLKYKADRYEKIRTGTDLWGVPYQKSFIESHKPAYIMNENTNRYELSDREAGFIKWNIDDACITDYSISFRMTFKIPTICNFNENIGVHDDRGMLRCAQIWKKKIDKAVPDFSEFKVEISYEY